MAGEALPVLVPVPVVGSEGEEAWRCCCCCCCCFGACPAGWTAWAAWRARGEWAKLCSSSSRASRRSRGERGSSVLGDRGLFTVCCSGLGGARRPAVRKRCSVAGSRASKCGCVGVGVYVCGWCWEACAYACTSTGGCDACTCGARCACCSMAALLTMGRRLKPASLRPG